MRVIIAQGQAKYPSISTQSALISNLFRDQIEKSDPIEPTLVFVSLLSVTALLFSLSKAIIRSYIKSDAEGLI